MFSFRDMLDALSWWMGVSHSRHGPPRETGTGNQPFEFWKVKEPYMIPKRQL